MLRWILLLFVLLASATAASAEGAPARDLFRAEVTGDGESKAQAENAAIRQAADRIDRYLAENHPDLPNRLSTDYLLRTKMVVRQGATQETTLSTGTPGYRSSYRAEVQPNHLNGLRELTRAQVMQYRHRQVAILGGGAVLILIVIGGALRLDTATRGYYSTRLFFTATALIGGIGWTAWQWL